MKLNVFITCLISKFLFHISDHSICSVLNHCSTANAGADFETTLLFPSKKQKQTKNSARELGQKLPPMLACLIIQYAILTFDQIANKIQYLGPIPIHFYNCIVRL